MFLKDQMYSFGLNYKNCKAVYLPPKQELKAPPFRVLLGRRKNPFLNPKAKFLLKPECSIFYKVQIEDKNPSKSQNPQNVQIRLLKPFLTHNSVFGTYLDNSSKIWI